MQAESEKRWDATVVHVSATQVEEGLRPTLTTSMFEDVQTPGANQYGFMLFIGRNTTDMLPVQDVKGIHLVERKVQAVVEMIRGN